MALREYRPTAPGMRHLIQVDKSPLWKGKPEKKLTEGKKKTGGRNNMGRLTGRNKGGGHKKRYRIIDWKRDKRDVEGKVVRLMDFGAFVAILPGRDGLVHISQISDERVERVSDKLKEGDVVKVKVLEVDRQGRVRLSMRGIE